MTPQNSQQLRLINLSLGIAAILLIIKVIGAVKTGSAAIYSDAAESIVHLMAVAFAWWAIRFAQKPADESHHFGHDKVTFLSAGFEGAMISAAAMLILYEAIHQIIFGPKIDNVGFGIALTLIAALINLILGLSLLACGKRTNSPLLTANGQHVLTDVWSSAAVLIALVLYLLTDWPWWDPIAAILAALNILRIGYQLVRSSISGLLDESDPSTISQICSQLDLETAKHQLSYHNFRHRHSGSTHWIEFHLVFDDHLSVGDAHHIATQIEASIAQLFSPHARVISHLEPRSAEQLVEEWEKK